MTGSFPNLATECEFTNRIAYDTIQLLQLYNDDLFMYDILSKKALLAHSYETKCCKMLTNFW